MLAVSAVASEMLVPAADTADCTCPLIALAVPAESPPFMMSTAVAMIFLLVVSSFSGVPFDALNVTPYGAPEIRVTHRVYLSADQLFTALRVYVHRPASLHLFRFVPDLYASMRLQMLAVLGARGNQASVYHRAIRLDVRYHCHAFRQRLMPALVKHPVDLHEFACSHRLSIPVHSVVDRQRSEEHTSELQSQSNLVCR